MRAEPTRTIPPVSKTALPGAQRVWLPTRLYAAIPWIYLGSGSFSLLGGLYFPDWAWPLPYALLFSIACLHTGARIAAMRRRHRLARQAILRTVSEPTGS